MIFVTLGSQKFQFNRLLQAVDNLILQEIIDDVVFAQIGFSDYNPKYYHYKQFLDMEEFAHMEGSADIVITHGGTGTIIGAVKMGKKVIAIPRLKKYGEHVDDHQIQLIKQFEQMNIICPCYDMDELGNALQLIHLHTYNIYKSNTDKIIDSINKYILKEI